MTAALLHVIAHAAFKTLLFLAAGSVLHATGIRDLDPLGGLAPACRRTTALFGVGALGGSALPLGRRRSSASGCCSRPSSTRLPAGGVATAVAMPLAVGAVALTAGLAVATFVKAFGVGFLARPRSEHGRRRPGEPADHAGRDGRWRGAGLRRAGVGAGAGARPRSARAAGRCSVRPIRRRPASVTVRLPGFAGSLVAAADRRGGGGRDDGGRGAGAAVRVAAPGPGAARLWDCGAGPLSARMQYTATSFAEPLQRVFDDVLRPEHDVDITHYTRVALPGRRGQLPAPGPRPRRAPPLPPGPRRRCGPGAGPGRALANGSVHLYLGYGFAVVCGALILLVVTR